MYTFRGGQLHIDGWETLPPDKIGYAAMEGDGWKDYGMVYDPYTVFASEGLGRTVPYVTSIAAIAPDPGDVLVFYTDYAWFARNYHVVALGLHGGELIGDRVLYNISPGAIDLRSANGLTAMLLPGNEDYGRVISVPFVNMYNATVMLMNVWENRDTIDIGVLDEIEDAPRKTEAKMPVAAASRSAVADGTGYFATVINYYGSEGSGKLVLYASRNAVDWEIVAEETIDAGIGLADVALSQGSYAAYLIAPGGKLVEYLVTQEETTTYELTQPESILYAAAVKPAGEYIAIVYREESDNGDVYKLGLVPAKLPAQATGTETETSPATTTTAGEETTATEATETEKEETTTPATVAQTTPATREATETKTTATAVTERTETSEKTKTTVPAATQVSEITEEAKKTAESICSQKVDLPVVGEMSLCTLAVIGLVVVIVAAVARKR